MSVVQYEVKPGRGVIVTLVNPNSNDRVEFDLGVHGEETEGENDDYPTLWREVLNNLSNGVRVGQTYINYYNCNGNSDVTFDYAANTVQIHCSNLGGSITVTHPIDPCVWVSVCGALLPLLQ